MLNVVLKLEHRVHWNLWFVMLLPLKLWKWDLIGRSGLIMQLFHSSDCWPVWLIDCSLSTRWWDFILGSVPDNTWCLTTKGIHVRLLLHFQTVLTFIYDKGELDDKRQHCHHILQSLHSVLKGGGMCCICNQYFFNTAKHKTNTIHKIIA